jgi:hypothetical protein
LAGIFGLLPFLGMLGIVGLYSLYLLYLGLPKLMKSPADKSVVYIIVIIVLMIVAAIIPVMVAGGIEGAARLSGGMASAPNGSITFQGKDGSATVNLNQMAAAASRMEAQASAMQAGTTTSAAPVKLADASALLALMPSSFNGAARSDTSTSSGGAGGIAASTAEATYAVGGGTIRLKISDIGTMAGLGAFANAMNVNTSSSSAGGYETVKTEGNHITTERYNTTEKSGEYDIVLNGRVNVSAEGSNIDMATLKSLVAQVDIGKADALTH